MTLKSTKKTSFFNVRMDILVCLFLVIATLLVYWQVRNHSFVNYDDRQYVTHNHYVNTGVTLESIKWSFTAIHASNWHPLTWLSHMLDCQIYGMNAGQHHLTNLLLHILNTLLLFLVFKRMTGKLWQSGFVAALFALHPLHVESVAWVAERKDLLSTFFWLLTLWSYTQYVERSESKQYLLTILFFILGLLAKPMLVTLPFVLLLLDLWPLRRFDLGSRDENNSQQRRFNLGLIYEKVPLFFLSALSSIVTYIAQESSGAVNSLAVIPFHIRIANATVSYASYIGKMIWPHNLAVFYPYPESILSWKIAGAGLLLGGISVAVCKMVRTKPYVAVGWLWYIGTLVPVIGIVQVGVQKMADRYTYIPLIGLFIIIAWGVPDILLKWRHKRLILAVSTTFVLSAFMICTWFQVKNWQNSIILFEHALNVTEDNSVAHINLGEALSGQGKIDAAVRHYYEALRIKPNLAAPHLNLGVALKEGGNLSEAINHFSKVLGLKSDCAEAHYELGDTLIRKGDFASAIEHYLEAVRIKPDYAKVYNNLGVILAHQNKDKEAIAHFYKAVQIDSTYAGAYYNLGKIFANQGKIEDAILNYNKTLHFSPENTQALYNLSWILATHENKEFRNGEEAERLSQRLCKITQYQQPLALDALAAANAETGKFDEAVSTAEKALKLALQQGPEVLAVGLKKRLKLYRQRRPYHQKLPEQLSSIHK
jgi:tetratricopeptide (TPR) repeat protein